jgi:serralysin
MALGSNNSAEVELSGNPDIDGILWGHRWVNPLLTYSFPTGTGEYGGYGGITGFQAFNSDQREAVVEIVANFNAVCGLNIVPGGAGSNLRFAEANLVDYDIGDGDTPHQPGSPLDSAEAAPPDPAFQVYRRGDAWFNHTSYENPVAGDFAFAAGLMHEIGHAVGLAHGHATQTITHVHGSHEKPLLPLDHDSQEYSIMTYRSYAGSPTSSNPRDYPQSLMMNDIAALQYIYGAYYGHRSNSSIYSWSSSTGEMSIDGVGQGVPAPVRNSAGTVIGSTVFRTIWDGGGIDTYDFSNYTTSLTVDLNPGAWSTIDTAQLAFLGNDGTNDRYARGNIANALLFQGDLRSLIENATGGSGHDRLTGNVVNNLLIGNSGADTLTGNGGNDRLVGGIGRDTLIGGDGIDQASYVGGDAGITADLQFSVLDTGDAAGDSYDSIENLQGTSFNDLLRGDDGDNVVEGGFGDGDDILVGLGGADLLIGASGDDRLVGGAGGDTLDGGGGADTASYGDAGTRIVADLQVVFGNTGDAFGDTYVGVENLIGSRYDDDLRGDGQVNILSGGGGADGLNGRGGHDRLVGGGGDDLYFLEDLAIAGEIGSLYDSVIETPDGGVDTVFVRAIDNPDTFSSVDRYTLGANIENGLISGDIAFNLVGNELNNVLTGNDNENSLTGHAGNDQLSGARGFDSLAGGAGDDIYVLSDLNEPSEITGLIYDSVTEADGEGIDSVQIETLDNSGPFSDIGRYTLGANIENGQLTGGLAFNLTGNVLHNSLTGNAATNILTGHGGDDLLSGLGGRDTLIGGLGDDVYVLADINQTSAFGGSDYDGVTEAADAGTDTIIVEALDDPVTLTTRERYTLAANVENGTIIGILHFDLTGNALDNILNGNDGANSLDGGAGADRLSGGLGEDSLAGGIGDDLYILNDLVDRSGVSGYDAIFESASFGGGSEGIDTVLVGRLALGPTGYTLGDQLENAQVAGTLAFNLIGNGLANTLTGNAAANILNGGGGVDTTRGGGGNDVHYVDSNADRALESIGGGYDRVRTSASYRLRASWEIEDLSARNGAATTTVNLTGNDFANRMTGNAGINTLRGDDGADALLGLAGADRLFGGAGRDVLSGGAGQDRFCFDTALRAGNVDRIGDLVAIDDTILLDRSIFTGIAVDGTLASAAFHGGAAAQDASDRIIYDSGTGRIYYDADGTGAATQILFATIAVDAVCTRTDFVAYASAPGAAAPAQLSAPMTNETASFAQMIDLVRPDDLWLAGLHTAIA